MDKFFALFGKFILVTLIIGGVAYGAYRLGNSTASNTPTGAVSVTAVPTPSESSMTNSSPSASPTKKIYKTVVAGVPASSQLSFSKYEITILDGWTYTNESTTGESPTDTLTITRAGNQIKIFQAATGGAVCLYPGDLAFEGPSSSYDEFVEITTSSGIKLRRSSTKGANSFTMCAKGSDGYGQPTGFGHISYKTSNPPDLVTLTEMDAMIATIRKL